MHSHNTEDRILQQLGLTPNLRSAPGPRAASGLAGSAKTLRRAASTASIAAMRRSRRAAASVRSVSRVCSAMASDCKQGEVVVGTECGQHL